MVTFNETTHLKNVNNCLNTNIYSYLETSGGQSSNPGNTKGGSITVQLTSCFTCLD
jgi:hypothetical protein